MMRLRVAVLGASGFGKYHLREFIATGCEIVAILGSSKKSVEKTIKEIYREYSLNVRGYFNLEELLSKENLDAVSICTPVETHFEFSKKCLNKGLHVLCEKPLLSNERIDLAKELIALARNKQRVFTVNTQWQSILEEIEVPKRINKFNFYSEPGTLGEGFIIDHLPHANSLLVKLMPKGGLSNLSFDISSKEDLFVRFDYKNKVNNCKTVFHFKYCANSLRKIIFSINSKEYKRVIGENYSQKLVSEGEEIGIGDPLKKSIGRFIDSIQKNSLPLITVEEILENVILQKDIVERYNNFINNFKEENL
ncbi:MAG: Gfo/Idh/MocA family oxidoreductase [archaeon]|nr:Gfo/Idh/MocA family oxidoreductase [archaeon]